MDDALVKRGIAKYHYFVVGQKGSGKEGDFVVFLPQFVVFIQHHPIFSLNPSTDTQF